MDLRSDKYKIAESVDLKDEIKCLAKLNLKQVIEERIKIVFKP